MDMGYTNSNALFAASDATGHGFGAVLASRQSRTASGIPMAASIAWASRPRTSQSQNEAVAGEFPLFGQWTDPRLGMPYTRQASLGWSHEIMPSTIMTIDFVRADGRDLNVRPRINVRINNVAGSPRQLTFLGLNPDAIGTRPGISAGKSEYTALITGVKRRLLNGFDFAAYLYAGRSQEHHRHGCRRAQREQPAGCQVALRRSAGLRPDVAHRCAALGLDFRGHAVQGLHCFADLPLSVGVTGGHYRGC